MLEAVRDTKRPRRAASFCVSASIHGMVLGWVALAPLVPPARPSLYDQEIRPYENKIVWYNLSERLPDISPPERDTRPPRARRQSQQTLVAGPRDNQRPQLIWRPAPEIGPAAPVPAPNVVALTPAAGPLRDFTLPAELARPRSADPALPDAPAVAIVDLKPVPLAAPARPQPKPFQPRVEERPASAPAELPAAPELAMAVDRATNTPLLPPIQPARRTFIPPLEATHAPLPQVAGLPAAPSIGVPGASAIPLPAGTTPRPLRPFAAPAPQKQEGPAAALAEAPAVANRASEAALAIVSPFPVREAPVPTPRSSQTAGFSQGPQPRDDGADSSAQASQLTVPGLLVRNGSKDGEPALMAALEPPTSRANLAAAARSIQPGVAGTAADPSLAHITAAPDPRLAGRTVYGMAVQMPNISSYSGSWLIWFAERDPARGQPAGSMQAPSPLRKVDPKYFPAALDEKVEGKVRLAGVIRKDGHVDHIELLQHLDERLDESSLQALGKWEFEPARRNGAAIEVDAVFEIPFHLAPKAAK